MGHYNVPPDIAQVISAMQLRISSLERSRSILVYRDSAGPGATAPLKPAAATVKGVIIFNEQTGKHEGSNGVTWNPLY